MSEAEAKAHTKALVQELSHMLAKPQGVAGALASSSFWADFSAFPSCRG